MMIKLAIDFDSGERKTLLATGAPELCVAVVAHRQQFDLSPVDRAKLEAHRRLALLDLGLAEAHFPNPPIGQIEHFTSVDEARTRAFLDELLAPIGGSLERAVDLAVRLTALRQGLLPRPTPLTLEHVLALPEPRGSTRDTT